MMRLIGILLIGAVLGGLVWGAYGAYKKQQSAAKTGESTGSSSQASPATNGGTTAPVIKPPVDPVTPVVGGIVPLEPKFVTAELGRAQRVFAECKFQETVAVLEKLDIRRVPSELTPKIEGLLGKAATFQSFISDVPATELVGHSDVVIVDLTTGGSVEGRLVEEKETYIRIRRIGGIVADIPRSQIRGLHKLEPVLAKAKLEQDYRDKVKRLGSTGSPLKYVELGITCYKQQLYPQTIEAFEKALSLDDEIVMRVAEEKARLAYQCYLWYLSAGRKEDAVHHLDTLLKKYPSSKYAQLAKEDMKNPEAAPDESGDVASGTSSGSGSGATPAEDDSDSAEAMIARGQNLFEQLQRITSKPPRRFSDPDVAKYVEDGNKAFDRAMEIMQECTPDDPDAAKKNRQAIDDLKTAARAYESALEIDGENSWLQARYRETNLYKANCLRRARVWR
ncbi:MAG: hypothetical protein RDV41_03630 [Planctomycetota bacterium]|nr:hypothetical protein [Planctomycetota bacterium]